MESAALQLPPPRLEQEQWQKQLGQQPLSTTSTPNNQTSPLPLQPHSEARFQLQTSPPESPTRDNNTSPKLKTVMTVRRSARARKPQRPYQDPNSDDDFQAPPSPTASKSRQAQDDEDEDEELRVPRRRPPKRKAAEEAPDRNKDIPDSIIQDSLAPIKPEERAEWNHWVELESDPAFFTFLLRELGAEDIKVQEALGLDEEYLSILPKPVYGLVFLYQYFDEDCSDDRQDCPDYVWFANQTTDNACGTVALLNIIMNSGIALGQELEFFRESTRHLCPPLRGWSVSKNSFIRNIHNSFTTRNDFLNAELAMENKFEKASKRRKVSNTKARPTKKKTKKIDTDSGFHFIAYVPIDGAVWELDGMQAKPLCIGYYDPSTTDWTTVAVPTINTRIAEVSRIDFNLLALCKAPQGAVRSKLASNIRALDAFEKLSHPKLKDAIPEEKPWISTADEEALRDFGLTPATVASAELQTDIKARLDQLSDKLAACAGEENLDSLTISSIVNLRESLETEHRRLKVEYSNEMAAAMEDDSRVSGRKKDYGPAIHLWVRKLAEKGVLQEIVEEVSAAD